MKNLTIYKRLSFLVVTLLVFMASCEKRELWLDPVEADTVVSLRSGFEAAQAAFINGPDQPEYTFRQSLKRTAHWDRVYQSESGHYFVPLTLSLEPGSEGLFDGESLIYPYKTVLMIEPDKDAGRYTMLTFIGEGARASEYSGILLFEDYFLGNARYTRYREGTVVRLRDQVEAGSLQMYQASGNGCGWVEVGTVCVKDFNGGNQPDKCYSHNEYRCEDFIPIDFEDAYDGGGGDENGGGNGGGGNGGGGDGGIDTSALTPEQKALIEDAVNEINQKCGFRAVYNKVMNEGNVKIVLGSNVNMAVYRANTQQIIYDSNAVLDVIMDRGELLIHELFHAYQHQFVYGTIMTSLEAGSHINIEFEQIVFHDIVRSMHNGAAEVGDMFKEDTKVGYSDAVDQYKAWIATLTNNGTVYPVISSIPTFNADYTMHINKFKIYGHSNYTGTDVIPGMLPDALKQLFNANLDCDN